MTVPATLTLVSPEEYMLLEEPAEAKSEYEDGEIIPMSGGKPSHNQIKVNIVVMLDTLIGENDFRVLNSDTRVRTPDSRRYTYPDVSVVAGAPQFDPQWETATLLNPCLIVEVLSNSTRRRDISTKFTGYQQILTFREYLLVEQDIPHVTQWVREPDNTWHSTIYTRLDDVIELASVPVALPVRRIYRHVPIAEEA